MKTQTAATQINGGRDAVAVLGVTVVTVAGEAPSPTYEVTAYPQQSAPKTVSGDTKWPLCPKKSNSVLHD